MMMCVNYVLARVQLFLLIIYFNLEISEIIIDYV